MSLTLPGIPDIELVLSGSMVNGKQFSGALLGRDEQRFAGPGEHINDSAEKGSMNPAFAAGMENRNCLRGACTTHDGSPL
jgi:hypothetical protein